MRAYDTSYPQYPAIAGPTIIAENPLHARLALAHKGLGDYDIGIGFPIKQIVNKIVQWDDLLLPSAIQLN